MVGRPFLRDWFKDIRLDGWKLGLVSSQFLNKDETLSLATTLDPEGLRGGIVYHDGQFDDARLALILRNGGRPSWRSTELFQRY